MNSFDKIFFKKFVPEWQEMQYIIHISALKILKNLFSQIVLFVVIPLCFYYYSPTINQKIPFLYFEIYLIFIYFKIIYSIFNWYNDVWIITNNSIIAVDWSFLKTKSESINFESIEWLWVDEEWFLDKILKKWTLIVHKVWEEEFILEDAIDPYYAIDLIESSGYWEQIDDSNNNISEERFNRILETISNTIWENSWEKVEKSLNLEVVWVKEKEIIKKQTIEKAVKTAWTIDLRDSLDSKKV